MQETNSLHVLTEHPIIVFLVGAILVGGLLLLVARFLAHRDSIKQTKDREDT